MEHAELPHNGPGRFSAGIRNLRTAPLNIPGFAALIGNHPAAPERVFRPCDASEKATHRAATQPDQLVPRAHSAGARDSSSQKTAWPEISPLRRHAVLLVDDEPAILTLERDLLELQGYAVLTASDGLEGVEEFGKHRDEIGLVVLDLVMPRMDGGQAYLAMKQLDPDLHAFFCTAHTTDDLMQSMFQEERLDALRKPFDASAFLKMVGDALAPPPRSGTPGAS